MCGIAGIVVQHAPHFQPHLQRMVHALQHRGPDAHASLTFDDALLGHARLSIVDLAGGSQPMHSALDPNVAVTFNGEIYGYQQLRSQFHDYPFRTTSDTEVLLAMYHRHREPIAQRAAHDGLPGMFAFALWDQNTRTLFAARDRFGEKPFYFATFEHEGTRGLLFASELKALLASGLIRPQLNPDALSHFLQYLYVHPHQTIYQNISTLPPGHRLQFHDGELLIERYWQLPPTQDIHIHAAVEQFRHLMKQAVQRQLVADVPVGAFLSGGLDSATVVALAAELTKNGSGLQTFAFRFAAGGTNAAWGGEPGLDETPYAHAVAQMHGTTHHVLADDDAQLGPLLQEMADIYDEPFADSSNIPTYMISRLARRHMKVVITGDGGDELLAGYDWYRPLIDGRNVPERRLKAAQYFSDDTLRKFGLHPSRMPKAIDRHSNSVDDAMRMDLLDYMPGDILVKIDRASMAHGLELRAPFLDVDLASFLISLPARLKVDDAESKIILRRAFSDLWPASVKNRSKQGFGAPVAGWLQRPDVAALAAPRLHDPHHPLFQLIPFDACRIAVERRNFQAWALLVLALWLERHPI
ncbi:MAG TPA: asparagine synthase (glutamine-hydrolyzing) [Phycisphaerae bacterium]|nr:asparagine synthase (glutamine-hydrolyzing) [Phycisphaerae bacterium]